MKNKQAGQSVRNDSISDPGGMAVQCVQGSVPRRNRLNCGITVSVDDFSTPESVYASFVMEESPLLFGYQVSGTTVSSFRRGGPDRHVVFSPGSNAVGYYPDTEGQIEYPGKGHHCAVTIYVPPEILFRYLEDSGAPKPIVRAMDGRRDERFVRHGKDTPAKRMLVRRILGDSHAPPFGNMFLEAACLELVALQLEELSSECSGAGRGPSRMSRADAERIRAARDILVRDLENPPSLIELARLVGINDFKLKRGFRELFGTTVFGYYRDYRLDKARELLDGGEVNVSEAAFRIGYLNLGHFSKAFQNRFGVRPSEYLRRHI